MAINNQFNQSINPEGINRAKPKNRYSLNDATHVQMAFQTMIPSRKNKDNKTPLRQACKEKG